MQIRRSGASREGSSSYTNFWDATFRAFQKEKSAARSRFFTARKLVLRAISAEGFASPGKTLRINRIDAPFEHLDGAKSNLCNAFSAFGHQKMQNRIFAASPPTARPLSGGLPADAAPFRRFQPMRQLLGPFADAPPFGPPPPMHRPSLSCHPSSDHVRGEIAARWRGPRCVACCRTPLPYKGAPALYRWATQSSSAAPRARNSCWSRVSPRRFGSMAACSNMAGSWATKADASTEWPASFTAPRPEKYVLQELASVLRRLAKAASAIRQAAAISCGVAGRPAASSGTVRSRRMTAESTRGGGKKLPGPTAKRPAGRA